MEWPQKSLDGLMKLVDVLNVIDAALDLAVLQSHQIKVLVRSQELV